MDLEGAPYGYTPMGSDRKEMEGFRFWNSGYWKGHLAGRPYHISALYIVDLVRFRQLAAGDRLREQYQGTSISSITPPPLSKKGATSGFEMCCAIASQHLWCRGSQPTHVLNTE